jgi:hypothetical protein
MTEYNKYSAPAAIEELRYKLFKGWIGCSSHNCVVTGEKEGTGTNGICQCIINAHRGQLSNLQARLNRILGMEE